jgi:assimilatory nitrate reductase catalytic subunit
VGATSVAGMRRLLLSPTPQAPAGFVWPGRVVCQCFDVNVRQIEAHLAGCTGESPDRLASLQGALRCGTNCGSCMPELRALAGAKAGRMAA